jgi:hypothetical protein
LMSRLQYLLPFWTGGQSLLPLSAIMDAPVGLQARRQRFNPDGE